MSFTENLGKNALPINITEVNELVSKSFIELTKLNLSSSINSQDYFDMWVKRLSKFSFFDSIKNEFTNYSFINGAINAFDSFYLRHSNKRLRVFKGDFLYHTIISRLDSLIDIAEVNDENPLINGDCLIFSLPFSLDGSVNIDVDSIIETCENRNIPVLIDMAYLPLVSDIRKFKNYSCIEDIVFSLSKFASGLERVRIGLRLRRNFIDDPIGAANQIGMLNNIGVYIGTKILEKFELNRPFNLYRNKQIILCEDLNIKPSDCVIFGIGGEEYNEFERAGVNRICLSEILSTL